MWFRQRPVEKSGSRVGGFLSEIGQTCKNKRRELCWLRAASALWVKIKLKTPETLLVSPRGRGKCTHGRSCTSVYSNTCMKFSPYVFQISWVNLRNRAVCSWKSCRHGFPAPIASRADQNWRTLCVSTKLLSFCLVCHSIRRAPAPPNPPVSPPL